MLSIPDAGCRTLAAAGVAWKLNGERWQQEYAAFRKTGAPVLMYHAVGPEEGADWPRTLIMKPELFEAHLQYLKEQGYTIVTVAELAERLQQGKSVDKYVALSFDDGYKNNHSVVLPLLQKYDAKGSFFVINRDIGDELHMNEQEIKELIAAGMELGSHTYSHNPLAAIDEKYLVWETDTSRYWLKKNLTAILCVPWLILTAAIMTGLLMQRKIRFLQGADWSCRC